MTLIHDLKILTTQGLRHAATVEAFVEVPHFLHDLILGAHREPKDPAYLYMDLHAHIPEDVTLSALVTAAASRVDVLAITARNPEHNAGHLQFAQMLEKLEQEGIEHQRLGKSLVHVRQPSLYLVQGYESYVKERQGVVMVGLDRKYALHGLTLDETVTECNAAGAMWFLDHPFSIGAPYIAFRYPTKEEMTQRVAWFEKYDPVIEVGNQQNTLWMFPSNILARRMAREYNVAGIANSDTHLRISEIGLSRTALPRNLLDLSSDVAFCSSLRSALSGHKEVIRAESGYSSIWSFTSAMLLPYLRHSLKR